MEQRACSHDLPGWTRSVMLAFHILTAKIPAIPFEELVSRPLRFVLLQLYWIFSLELLRRGVEASSSRENGFAGGGGEAPWSDL